MEVFEAAHEIKYIAIRRGATGMISLCGANDDIDDVGKTAAATAAFFHCMVDLSRHDQLPTVLVEKTVDGVLDFLFTDEIATANQHLVLPVIRKALNYFHKAKADIFCQEKITRGLHAVFLSHSKLDEKHRIFRTLLSCPKQRRTISFVQGGFSVAIFFSKPAIADIGAKGVTASVSQRPLRTAD